MHWRDRAQRNPFAVIPLIVITRGWDYDPAYRHGANEDMEVLQDFLYHQCGKTWRTKQAKRINSWKTAEEHAQGNVYLDIAAQAGQQGIIDFCNPYLLIAVYATGYPVLANMGGRSAFGCSPWPDNPLEPWGPGRAGGPSGWAIELTAGHPVDAPNTRSQSRGALLHEMLHCLGIQHPDENIDGPEAWLSPMAGFWFFGTGDANGNPCALLPREIAELRGETAGAGADGRSPKPGSHFFR